ncbi:MAG TPA: energy transducer TonB [Burkholderiales bacterium]|nr:energy transducer TonB [Burkholderiales bacterium]
MAQAHSYYAAATRGTRFGGAAVVVALHIVVLAALWQLEPVRKALRSTTIMVDLLEIKPPPPAPEKPPKPLPSKPRVQPKPRTVAPPPPVLTAPPEAPVVQAAPAPVPVPLPPIEAPPPPPAPVAVAPPAPPAPKPEPVTPPSFNAAYLNNPSPAYPPVSRRMGEEGKVILRVHVTEQGLPDEVQVKTSSGFSRLDAVALETVRQWKFMPARRGSSPVSAWVLVPISFSLRS